MNIDIVKSTKIRMKRLLMTKNRSSSRRYQRPSDKSELAFDRIKPEYDQGSARKFFDVGYIFNQPRNKSHRPLTSHNDRAASRSLAIDRAESAKGDRISRRTMRDGPHVNKVMMIDEDTLENCSTLQKTTLTFDDRRKGLKTIHSQNRQKTQSNLGGRVSFRQHRQSEPSTSMDGVLITKGLSVSLKLPVSEKEKKPRQRKRRIQIQNLECSQLLNRKEVSKKLRYIESQQYKNSHRTIEETGHTLSIKNKRMMRIYQPWSPLPVDPDEGPMSIINSLVK